MARYHPECDPLIRQAIKIAGSQPKLAERIGCVQQTISKLLMRQARVTADVALKIEAATGGQVRARELRPDLPWPEVAA